MSENKDLNDENENEEIIIHSFENNYSNLNPDDIELGKPVVVKRNNDKIFFSKLKTDIFLETPELDCMNSFYEHNEKKYINISLENIILSEKILEIDNKIIILIKENFKKWFHKSVSIESILEYFIPTKMYNKDLKSFFILEVPLFENEIDINIYDFNNNLIKINDNITINKTSNIIKLNGVYLEKNKFYCNWELIQTKIK